VDPAILSFAKPAAPRPATQLPLNPPQPSIQPVSPVMIADGMIPSPLSRTEADLRAPLKQSSVSSIATTAHVFGTDQKPPQRRDSQATAVLTEPFDALALEDQVGQPEQSKKKKNKHKATTSNSTPGLINVKDINGSLTKQPKKQTQAQTQVQGKGKGWRQTPLIEELPTPNSKAPRDRRRGRRRDQEADVNGWATEDATDIQDMGDFDFESNLSKFDKRRVFDDIRRDDTTADDERLVSFNRLPRPKPGTNGGRNLHWSENVLETPTLSGPAAGEAWNSEAGETENEVAAHAIEKEYSSGRGSRRATSRSARPLQSRKGSTLLGAVERTASPRPYATVAASKIAATSPMNGSGSVSGLNSVRASFRLKSGKPCHCVSPLQMLEVEQLCISEMGLTEDMLSENAGRSIADAVLNHVPLASSSGVGKEGKEVRNVLFLVGNHKSGARAIAAARHLRNRRLRVTVILLGGDRGDDMFLESVRKQLSIYRKGGGWVERWDEYQSKMASHDHTGAATNGSGHAVQAPDVIVDALLGVHIAFDELRLDEQASVFEMVRWAGRISTSSSSSAAASGTAVLSIDVPSGLSPTSGLITEAEGQLLVMNAKTVVCLGAPKIGLLHAMAMDGADEGVGDAEGAGASGWNVLVADIGISTAVWQRHGSRRRQGVEFGREWVVRVGLVGG
jgi:enhancer of mRNA-decapping protein 3